MNIDNLLRRTILSGKEYEPLFPKVDCDKSNLGSGDTFQTVKLIKMMVAKYQHQTAKLSALLNQGNLKDTKDKIYWFLYNHIQYKADQQEQNLRSPACAFKQRVEGVDCKTYSIFASCILSNLGIKHHIRQIKQPSFKSHLYTHVYVVVPIDQTTGDLKNGHYVIDGTTSNNQEPIYTMAQDSAVNLQHYGLNAPRSRKTTARKPTAKKTTTRKPATKKSGFFGKALLVSAGVLGGFFLGKQNTKI